MDDDGRSEHHPQVFIPIPSGSNHHGPFILHMPSYAHENDFIGGSTTQLWYGKCPFLFSISTPRSPPVFRHRPPSRRLCHRVLTRGFTRLGERERVRAGLQGLARSGALDTKWRGDRAIRRCDRAGDRREKATQAVYFAFLANLALPKRAMQGLSAKSSKYGAVPGEQSHAI